MCRPCRGRSRSRMISGRRRLTTYENTEKRKPGKTSSLRAAPPMISSFSSTSTRLPARARYAAHTRPLCPPPTTIASQREASEPGLIGVAPRFRCSLAFALRIEERLLRDARQRAPAMMLDRHLDLELPADFGVLGLEVG